ncbi:hypothetical protein Rhal01_02509 [Rubritalea halochordaticola]|uniref:Uncharacterized protein n=1 Tax=Rubritalea halochordaticola TaxID=714537 RepID=A0ABP9V5E9_9BACT
MLDSRHKRAWLAAGICLALFAAVCGWLMMDQEYERLPSPDGRYTAIVSYPRYATALPALPGGGGDKAGHIHIIDAAGESYGELPLFMLSQANDLEWTRGGARIKGVGEWDFASKTCQSWEE